jgi:predicted YcjX-like family ATPase
MLRERYNYYCEQVVKAFYKNYFLRFDRQIVLVDCLQPLNSGPQAFNDMRLALTQLMQSFHYGQRTLFRRLFSPVIDKLLFAATKADHVTLDQHANMVSLLQQLIQDAWQNAAFEGISMDCVGLASVQATQSGVIDVNGEKIPALRGHRLSDGSHSRFTPARCRRACLVRHSGKNKVFSLSPFVLRRWMWINHCRISVWTLRWNFYWEINCDERTPQTAYRFYRAAGSGDRHAGQSGTNIW